MKDPTTGLNLLPHSVAIRKSATELILTSNVKVKNWQESTSVWLHKWAVETPDSVFLAQRSGAGWREVTYAEALQIVRNVASALISRGLDQSTPIAILSGNSVDHALLSFAAQYVGVPTVPMAEQYSLIPEAHGRLLYIVNKVKPKLIFADDAGRYAAALALDELQDIEIVASCTDGSPRRVTAFEKLLNGDSSVDLEAARTQVGADTIAKILFTSGSSSDPKGVITTQRMMCANQAQMGAVLPFLDEKPPRILDWLPWNHVFGGSHNVNMMLAHGGAAYIDDGKPTKSLFGRTVRNVTDKAGTIAFNVPVGFSMLVGEMETNLALRKAYFQNLDMLLYAGASLPQDLWRRLEEMAMEVKGRLPLMTSSWGMTETAPATLFVHEHIGRSGVVGVPLPATEIKLLPDQDMRYELRVKGPNVMPGYLNDPVKTAEAFDEEGFLITGDAVRFVDIDDPNRGLVFDGRIGEDFKLLSGTWVQAGKLRLDALDGLRGLVQDVVICGHDRESVGIFIIPGHDQIDHAKIDQGAIIDPDLSLSIQTRLRELAAKATGSATRISRALILADPPSLKDGEVTDKGSLNVRKITTRRAGLVDRLYKEDDSAVIVI